MSATPSTASPLLPAPGLSGGTLAASGHAPRRSAGERGGPIRSVDDLPAKLVRDTWKRYLGGVQQKRLARELGVHPKTLRRAWSACGYGAKPETQERRVARALRLRSMCRKELIEATGLWGPSVSALLHKLGARGFIVADGERRFPGRGSRTSHRWTLTDAGRTWLAGEP